MKVPAEERRVPMTAGSPCGLQHNERINEKSHKKVLKMTPEKMQMLQRFIDDLRVMGMSPHTIKMYNYFVKKYLEWADELSAESVKKFLRHLLLDLEYKNNSIYLATMALKKFFENIGYKNIASLIEPPKRPKNLPKYLTEREIGIILKKAREISKRDYLVLAVLAYTGMRVSELCNLHVEDVDTTRRIIHIRGGKGSKDRIVIIPSHLADELEKYIRDHNMISGPLFPGKSNKNGITPRTIQRLVKKYAKMCNIKKEVTPHVFRHSFATNMLRRGADIRYIQRLLGHSSLSTTEIYTHLSEADLITVYDRTHPKYEL